MIYYLSQKQEEAKEKLETLLKIKTRGNFPSKDDFDGYMQMLIKKIKKKINLDNNVRNGQISREEINNKRKEKIEKYYNTEKGLRNYALKYSSKYIPSHKKLLSKLLEKSNGNHELSNNIINNLLDSGIIENDDILCKKYINQYMLMGKNINKIQSLLIRKEFDKDLINKNLDNIKNELKHSLLDPFSVERKILGLLKKGKSEYYIKQKLSENEFDLELINSILEELNFDNNDIMNKELDKLKCKGIDKNKIIQKMLYKGYKYSDFKDRI